MTFRYRVVDVFTQKALEGNPLAVFPDSAGIDESLMQPIAKELNLSETVFVLPSLRPGCAARLRIFTPQRELPFAGHPTVGTAWVLLDEGRVIGNREAFGLEEGVGEVPVRVDDEGLIWLTTPPIRFGPTFERSACAAVIGLPVEDLLSTLPQLVSAGNPAIFIAVRDRAAVDGAMLELPALRELPGSDEAACMFVFAPVADGAYSRMFAPEMGVVEDPATGSATGPLAAYMQQHALLPRESPERWVSEQGTKMGRRSILHVQMRKDGAIEVGGHVTPVAEATMRL
jgi:trans-2,3-dihydro-3-hydroxyanthranilate isomerase